eukprot:TRINITY_DN8330_c0_g1_i2.p1 TRINITY_DN8330_c0_g1~~TRINITY_DN8330_c0_g1_i2.p1  ORF type:complete len:793 (+),score=103.75 TRINITY_DN8330_c0_g1_i2:28-2406(+)
MSICLCGQVVADVDRDVHVFVACPEAPPQTPPALIVSLGHVHQQAAQLGVALPTDCQVIFYGTVNSGKSTLINSLLALWRDAPFRAFLTAQAIRETYTITSISPGTEFSFNNQPFDSADALATECQARLRRQEAETTNLRRVEITLPLPGLPPSCALHDTPGLSAILRQGETTDPQESENDEEATNRFLAETARASPTLVVRVAKACDPFNPLPLETRQHGVQELLVWTALEQFASNTESDNDPDGTLSEADLNVISNAALHRAFTETMHRFAGNLSVRAAISLNPRITTPGLEVRRNLMRRIAAAIATGTAIATCRFWKEALRRRIAQLPGSEEREYPVGPHAPQHTRGRIEEIVQDYFTRIFPDQLRVVVTAQSARLRSSERFTRRATYLAKLRPFVHDSLASNLNNYLRPALFRSVILPLVVEGVPVGQLVRGLSDLLLELVGFVLEAVQLGGIVHAVLGAIGCWTFIDTNAALEHDIRAKMDSKIQTLPVLFDRLFRATTLELRETKQQLEQLETEVSGILDTALSEVGFHQRMDLPLTLAPLTQDPHTGTGTSPPQLPHGVATHLVYLFDDAPLPPFEAVVSQLQNLHIVPDTSILFEHVLRAQHLQQTIPNLTVVDILVIFFYTFGDGDIAFYNTVNDALRNQLLPEFLVFAVKHLIRALLKLPDYSGTTYRGSCLPMHGTERYVVGSVVVENSFLSSSTSADVACQFAHTGQRNRRAVLFKIQSLRGKLISQCSAFPQEDEILFLPFTRFRVISVGESGPVPVIVLEELVADVSQERVSAFCALE